MSDSDLDDELMYLAGRKRTAPKKRGRQASDSDSDYGHEAHAVHKEQKAPSKRSKKPAAEAPHVEPADDDADPMSTLPPEEQARLLAMTELEREQALFELVEARDRERDRQRLHQREEQRVEPRASSRRARNQTHAEGAAAIGKLAAARQKQEVRAQRRERETAKDSGRGKGKAGRELDDDEKLFEFDDDEEDMGGGSEEDEEEEEEEEAGGVEEDMELSDDDQELQEVVMSEDEGRGLGEGGDKEDDEAAYAADYRDVGTIILKRNRLERWHDEPFFGDAVTGCMVRIAVGTYRNSGGKEVPNYQLMRITEVVTRNSYKMPNGTRTDKWLRLEDSGVTKAMQMVTISNSEPAEEEFERYKRHCEAAGVPLITKGDVAAITKQIEAARNYRYKPEDIKRRVDQRRAKGLVVGGWAAERSRLERELERAAQEGDEDKADALRRDMEELGRKMDARYAPAGAARAMADVNTRNRAANNTKALKGTGNKVTGLAGVLGGEEGGVDVFSRRHTASKVYWKTGADGVKQQPAGGGEAAAAAAKAASAAQQLRRTSSTASDTKKVKAHQVNMDPLQLVKELPMEVDLTRLRQSKALVRRLLGPRWRLPDCSHEIAGREVLTLSEWKQRMNTTAMMEG